MDVPVMRRVAVGRSPHAAFTSHRERFGFTGHRRCTGAAIPITRGSRILVSAKKTSAGGFDWFGLFKPKSEPEKAADSAKAGVRKAEQEVKDGVEATKRVAEDGVEATKRGAEDVADTAKEGAESAKDEAAAGLEAGKAEAESGIKAAAKAEEANDAEKWGKGFDNDWGQQDVSTSKPDPLGYFIMAAAFLGVIALTTTAFRLAGAWRSSRGSRRADLAQTTSTSASTAKAAPKAESDTARSSRPESSQSGVLQPYTDSELKSMKELGERDARENAAPSSQKDERGIHDMVYTGQGWVHPSATNLEGYEADSSGADDSAKRGPIPQISPATAESSAHQEAPSSRENAESNNLSFEIAPLTNARGTSILEAGGREDTARAGSILPNSHFEFETSRPHEEAPQQPSTSREPANDFAQTPTRFAEQSLQSSDRLGLHDEGEKEGTRQEHSQDAPHAKQEEGSLEDFERQANTFLAEEEAGTDTSRSVASALPKVEAETSQRAVDASALRPYRDASLSSLRARAAVASRASLAAIEASQRAASYSSAASQASSHAAAYAERAATASSIAQQAADAKSEKVLRVAVERAERATHEATAAERRAAEAAAHATAHQEVSTSQADVAEQAAELPDEADPEEMASPSWREASKEKLSLGRLKATNAFHACKAWLQRSVHILRGWLSGAVAWLQQLWPTITDAAIRFWHWILTPFQKTAH